MESLTYFVEVRIFVGFKGYLLHRDSLIKLEAVDLSKVRVRTHADIKAEISLSCLSYVINSSHLIKLPLIFLCNICGNVSRQFGW